MKRIVTLVVVVLIMVAMVLSVAAPAMAAPVCPSGLRAQPLIVTPGPEPVVLFDCVPLGQPGQPPVVGTTTGR